MRVPFVEPRASSTGADPFRCLDRRLTPTSYRSVLLYHKLTPPSAPPLHRLAHKPDAASLPARSSSAVLLRRTPPRPQGVRQKDERLVR